MPLTSAQRQRRRTAHRRVTLSMAPEERMRQMIRCAMFLRRFNLGPMLVPLPIIHKLVRFVLAQRFNHIKRNQGGYVIRQHLNRTPRLWDYDPLYSRFWDLCAGIEEEILQEDDELEGQHTMVESVITAGQTHPVQISFFLSTICRNTVTAAFGVAEGATAAEITAQRTALRNSATYPGQIRPPLQVPPRGQL